MGTFFELGKDKTGKGEGWALPFICYAHDTVGSDPGLPLWLLGYGKPLHEFSLSELKKRRLVLYICVLIRGLQQNFRLLI